MMSESNTISSSNDNNKKKGGEGGGGNALDSFFMELSLDELTHLFQDLEKIQEQLDVLS